MQPSIDSGNVANGIQSDRSITPLLPDFMDPTMCYLPNGYPSAFYFSGNTLNSILVNLLFVYMHSQLVQWHV